MSWRSSRGKLCVVLARLKTLRHTSVDLWLAPASNLLLACQIGGGAKVLACAQFLIK